MALALFPLVGSSCGDSSPSNADGGSDAASDASSDTGTSPDASDAGDPADASDSAIASDAAADGIPDVDRLTVSDEEVTIAGLDFGERADAGPIYFQEFTETTDGAAWTNAGLDFVANPEFYYTVTQGTVHVDMAQGFGGGGSLRIIANLGDGSGQFTHHGIFLPDDLRDVTVSYWVKVRKNSATTAT